MWRSSPTPRRPAPSPATRRTGRSTPNFYTGRGAGDRFGDLGDSGGGDNNHGKGDGVGESREKKMALSMSQKLTLGYAALAGGKNEKKKKNPVLVN